MEELKIKKQNIKPKFTSKFVNLFDIEYEPGRHYFDATRRDIDNVVAIKSNDEFKNMLPDAVTCIVIIKQKGEEPRLLLNYEYRYPTGQFLLSPPAGLIDPEDLEGLDPLRLAAVREIREETGIEVKDSDRVFTVNPLVFSTPGLTDECNALVCAVIELDDLCSLTQDNCVGTEKFSGFEAVNVEAAKVLLKNGRDKEGRFYSLYTWATLMYFISGMWEE
ncbi:MAG: NUDIX hydrolase [Lachnospiraceae bacterium]|nr:NUDIX hydrolase [Lachnospiraceae bacterium]